MTSWATNLAARASSWAVLVRIEGIGDANGQWVFCSSIPSYADQSHKPWLLRMPEILSERVDLGGGVPEAGSCSVQILDKGDALTALLRTEAEAYTSTSEEVDSSETEIEVGRNTDLNGLVIWIGSEAMKVTGIASSPTRVTVTRGWLGTDAITHDIRDPIYIYPNFLEGRRFSVYLVPLDGDSAADERLVGTYLLENVRWDEPLNAWIISGTTQQRYLDRQAPIAPRTGIVRGTLGSVLTIDSSRVRGFWGDYSAHVLVDDEIIQLKDPVGPLLSGGGLDSILPAGISYQIIRRAMHGTRQADLKQGAKVTQVFLAGEDLRYSPGPSPSTSRTSGTWTKATHWVDLLLILLLSSADEADGLELTNRRSTGSDWSRSNFASLPPGYGAGIPHALIDWASWEDVRTRMLTWTLPFFAYGGADPISFAELVKTEFLRPFGAYLSFEQGTLRLSVSRVPAVGETPALQLTTDNLLRSGDGRAYLPRMSVSRDRASLFGSVTYKVGPQALAATYRSADYGRTYGQRGWYGATEKGLTIKVPGGDPATAEALGARGAALLYRNHKPPVEIDAEVDAGLFSTATVGAIASVTIPEIPDAAIGTRGWTSVLAEVVERELQADVSRSRDGSDALGLSMRLRLRRYGATTRVGRIGHAAYISSVTGSTATVSTNRFTQSDAASPLPVTDAAAFEPGDKLILVNADGSIVSSTPETIVSIAGDNIELTDKFSNLLAAGKYLVSANVGDAATNQRGQYVYHADRATQTVGATDDGLWKWGEP